MPFPRQDWRPFTSEDIEALEPGQNSCYGILNSSGTVIYIGKGDVRQKLLGHWNGDNQCILRHNPVYWVYVLTPNVDALEKALLLEYKPPCNKQ